MFQVLFGVFFLVMGLWLFIGDPGNDPAGRYFGSYGHAFFQWLADIRPWSTILSFVFSVASFITIKRY